MKKVDISIENLSTILQAYTGLRLYDLSADELCKIEMPYNSSDFQATINAQNEIIVDLQKQVEELKKLLPSLTDEDKKNIEATIKNYIVSGMVEFVENNNEASWGDCEDTADIQYMLTKVLKNFPGLTPKKDMVKEFIETWVYKEHADYISKIRDVADEFIEDIRGEYEKLERDCERLESSVNEIMDEVENFCSETCSDEPDFLTAFRKFEFGNGLIMDEGDYISKQIEEDIDTLRRNLEMVAV